MVESMSQAIKRAKNELIVLLAIGAQRVATRWSYKPLFAESVRQESAQDEASRATAAGDIDLLAHLMDAMPRKS